MRASESLNSTWNIVREDNYGNAIIEQDGLFYVVNVDGTHYNFRSALPSDMPVGGGCWAANWTEAGLQYVAKGRTKTAAYSQWRRHIKPLSALYSA